MKFLIDLTNLPYSNKHYGGNAGLKRGVIIDDKNWLLKFPQETSIFDNVTISLQLHRFLNMLEVIYINY